jgi:hypothetical protein
MSETNNQTPSGDTFIRERRRGFAQGQKDLLTRAGAKDDQELLALIEAGRKASKTSARPEADEPPAPAKPVTGKKQPAEGGPPEQKENETLKQYEARLAKIDETQAKIWARFEAEDKAKAEAKAAEELAAKEAAEEKAAREQYEEEVEWLKTVASGVGAVTDDKRKFNRLVKLVEQELADMPKREFESKFGDKASEKDREENTKKLLAELQKDHSGLFKPAGNGNEGEKKPAGTTGAAVTPPEGAKPASGQREPLNVQKLSREQYREYSQNPTKFKERYAAGLVEYPSKK